MISVLFLQHGTGTDSGTGTYRGACAGPGLDI